MKLIVFIMSEKSKYKEQLKSIYKNLYRVAISLRGANINEINKYSAEDLVHDTFEYLVKNSEKYIAHPNLEAFAIWKMKNINIDKYRSEQRKEYLHQDQDIGDNNQIFSDEESEDVKLKKFTMYKAMEKLGEDCQQILNLQISGNSYQSIANILTIEVGTVGSRLLRCTEKLGELVNA